MHDVTNRPEDSGPESHDQETDMKVRFPVRIVFRHMPRSAAATKAIQGQAVIDLEEHHGENGCSKP